MIKKGLPIVLVLVALLSSFALAEGAGDVRVTYTHAAEGYSFQYPEGWTFLSKDTAGDVQDAIEDGTGIAGLDPSMLEQYKAQIESTDTILCISPTGAVSFTVTYTDVPLEMSVDTVISMICPATIAQYKTMFSHVVVADAGSLAAWDENEFASMAVSYELSGVQMVRAQLIYPHGTRLYIITFTVVPSLATDLDALDAASAIVAGSFSPGA